MTRAKSEIQKWAAMNLLDRALPYGSFTVWYFPKGRNSPVSQVLESACALGTKECSCHKQLLPIPSRNFSFSQFLLDTPYRFPVGCPASVLPCFGQPFAQALPQVVQSVTQFTTRGIDPQDFPDSTDKFPLHAEKPDLIDLIIQSTEFLRL